MKLLSEEQRRKIFAAAREKGIDNELLHDMVEELTGKASIKLLTMFDAKKVIDRLEGKEEKPGPVYWRASSEQLKKIKELVYELGWQDNPKRLQGFIKKYAGTEMLQWLTTRQASNVIEGLKSILKNSHSQCQK